MEKTEYDARRVMLERDSLDDVLKAKETAEGELATIEERKKTAKQEAGEAQLKLREVQDEIKQHKKTLETIQGEIDKQGETTQEKREELASLKRDKESFIERRKKQAEEALLEVTAKLAKSQLALEETETEATTLFTKVVDKIDETINVALGLVTRAENFSDTATNYKQTAEKLLKSTKERETDLQKRIDEINDFEKGVKTREEEADKLHTKAEEKLKKAEDLADWADKPGTYHV